MKRIWDISCLWFPLVAALALSLLLAGKGAGDVPAGDFNSAPGRFNSIKAADIDGDGKIEVVYGDYEGFVTVLEYSSGDLFLEWKYEVGGDRVWGLELGDVNGDGKTEIVAGNGMGKIFVLSGEGPDELWRYEGHGRDAHGLALYDFSGNGTEDICVGTAFKNDDPNGMLYVIRYGAEEPMFMTERDDSRWRGIDVGDVDGDGTAEIVVGSGSALGDVKGSGFIRIFNVSDNDYSPERDLYGKPEWTSPDLGGCVQGIAVEDVDNDGVPNIVASVGYRYNEGLAYIFQYGAGEYSRLWKSDDLGAKPYGFLVADVDGDDVLEIVVGNQPGRIRIIDGRTRETEWTSSALGTDVMGLCAVDLDADPQLEIIAAQGGYQGKGDFTSGYTLPHLYVIDGKTHEIELVVGERDMTGFALQSILLVLIIFFLIEISVLGKLVKTKRRRG